MSECVVRMEMPKCCANCPLLDDYGDYPRCSVTQEQRGYNFPIFDKRMPLCPIICSLPEGHGRLVDADAIPRFASGGVYTAYHFIEAIADTPTIVPAERSEHV